MTESFAPLKWHESPFKIGDHLVDPKRNRVTGPAGESALQPKVIDVLCALAERQGEVLSRSDLIDRVWGKEFGADESLTRAISQLRKAFGDTREVPQVIETISKRGYRLMIAPIAMGGTPTTPRPSRRILFAGIFAIAVIIAAALLALRLWPAEAPPAPSERTGIVVTVEQFTSDDRALPVTGLADELSAELARSPLVRARTATASGPIGADVIQYRLHGEISRIGERLRINAQLLDAGTGEAIWGEGYDEPYDRQFSAREKLVAAISRDSFYPLLRAVRSKLLQRPALSLSPWEATLLVTWVPGSERMFPGPPTEESYWLQRHALQIDPDFAPAHALFAQLASWHMLFDPPSNTPATLARARHHAERAIELAPYDSEVLYQLSLYYRAMGDRERASAMIGRVLTLQPNHPLAAIDREFLAAQCQPNAGAAVARLTDDIRNLPASSPTRWVALMHLSSLYLTEGEFERARDAALASRRIVPSTWTAMTLAGSDAALGRNAEAAQVLAEHRREWPNMDLRYFAEHIVPRWCLGGPRTRDVQQTFRHLADVIQPAQK
jgi:DNA-binding winged helix-turn-helix (wHTH) protein/TolB-like protein